MGKYLSKYSSEADYNNNKDNHIKPHISLITTSPKKMKYEKKVLTNLITFYVDNIEYQAEEGMTWEEWLTSEYSSFESFSTASTFAEVFINGQWFTITFFKNKLELPVGSSAIINSGTNYILVEVR